MSDEYWFDNAGQNMLAGVAGDESNPIRLPDDYIIDFLARRPEARASFERLLSTMLPAEQTRLQGLARSADATRSTDPNMRSDIFQSRMNGVRVPRGGGWRPPD
jgi:hypothetical protein